MPPQAASRLRSPRPVWAVVVQQGMVVATYSPEQTESTGSDNILAGCGIGYGEVFAVDGGTPPPPVGSEVDPTTLGWRPWSMAR